MEQSTYLIAIFAGVFYLIASHRLIRLSGQTGERPELWLGIFFAISGLWFLAYHLPYLLGLEALPPLLENAIEWIYALGVIPYLLFIRRVFRSNAGWATGLVFVLSAFLLTGVAVSTASGGYDISLQNPWFLLEWVGYTVPCVWMCAEGALAHAGAKRRVRIGLCDPSVANRYLLLACFALFQTSASAAELGWASKNGTEETISSISHGLLGGSEIASMVALWLAFFPPAFYRNWISGRAVVPPTPAEES